MTKNDLAIAARVAFANDKLWDDVVDAVITKVNERLRPVHTELLFDEEGTLVLTIVEKS